MKLIIKLALFLLIAMSLTQTYDFVNAKQSIIFTHPTEKEEQVFQKNDVELISGEIITQKDLEYAEISFDGLLWRNLNLLETSDGYSFEYEWTVAGKGRFFIIVNSYTPAGDLIDGRILSEVYVPPELEEEGLKSMLSRYQKEQEAKQKKAKEALEVNKVGTFIAFESITEKTIGEFLVNDWKALLPTREQMEFAMSSTVYVYNFVNTYQAGIDIFFLLTLPLGVVLIVLVFMFVYLDYSFNFFEYLFYLLKRPKSNDKNKIGILFDDYALSRIPFAKIVLRNMQTNSKHELVSDKNGLINMDAIADGEYNYEVQKHGYKTHILDDIELGLFQDMPVAKDNTLTVSSGGKVAMPVERLVSLERKYTNDKASIFYKPKSWFLSGLPTWISIGCLIMVLYMIFIDIYYPLAVCGYLILAYAIYHSVIKTHCSWGMVYSLNNTKATGEKLELFRNQILFGATWTDFEGKYDFEGIDTGTYTIRPGGKYKIAPMKRYYKGDCFDIGEDKCLLKKNIILEKESTK